MMTNGKTVAVEATNLGKVFRQRHRKAFQALDGIDLEVRFGEICGLLGRNGAGKSTLVKIVCGLQRPTKGLVLTLGHDPAQHRSRITRDVGVVFGHKSSLWWDLSLADNLKALGSLYRVPSALYRKRCHEMLEGLALSDLLDRPIRQMSLGERVKSELAGALLHGPRLLVLDEPTIGLDLVSKHHLRNWLVSIARNDDVAILLTSHDTGDIASLCQRITLIENGRTAFSGTVDGLRSTMANEIEVRISGRERAMAEEECSLLRKAEEIDGCRVVVAENRDSVSLIGPEGAHDELIRLALCLDPARNGLTIETGAPSLEDVLVKRFRELEAGTS